MQINKINLCQNFQGIKRIKSTDYQGNTLINFVKTDANGENSEIVGQFLKAKDVWAYAGWKNIPNGGRVEYTNQPDGDPRVRILNRNEREIMSFNSEKDYYPSLIPSRREIITRLKDAYRLKPEDIYW